MDETDITSQNDEAETTVVSLAYFWAGFPLVALCNFLASLISLFVFVAMIANRKIRTNPYNYYIIWLIFPDGLNTMLIALKYTFWSVNEEVLMPNGFYEVRIFVYFFYFIGNFYLNAVVAYEINKLATSSYHRKKVPPPTLSKVYKQVGAVYLLAFLFGLWSILPVSWSIFHFVDGTRGKTVLGSPPGGAISELVGTAIIFGSFFIPMFYVIFVRIRIAVKKLLPKKGRTRVLSLFYMRILIVFVLFYIPSTVLSAVFIDDTSFYWVEMFIGFLTACQALVTIYMVCLKDDIRKIVHEALPGLCKKCCCRPIASGRGNRTSVSGLSQDQANMWKASDVYSATSGVILNTSSAASGQLSSQNLKSEASEINMKSEWEQEDVYETDEQNKDQGSISKDDVERARLEGNGNERISHSVDMTGEIQSEHERMP